MKASGLASLASRWRRSLRCWGCLGLLGASAAPVLAQTAPAAQPVPQQWIDYAQRVSRQLQQGLGDPDDKAVAGLQAWMQERILSQAVPPASAPLVVRVWISSTGRIERVDFDSLGQAQADADLRATLTARTIGEPPPPEMRQPLVLQLGLDFE